MSPRRNEPVIDVLPEQHQYRDEGCSVSPSCLRCPLPWCKYDDPAAYHRELRLSRDREVMQVKREQGKSVPQLAQPLRPQRADDTSDPGARQGRNARRRRAVRWTS